MNRNKLIAITLVLIMLLSCIMPVLKVGAQTDVTITFGRNLYEAVRDELIKQGVFATYNDKQRSIVINDEEMAKVTELNLANGEIDDVTGLENFINLKKLDLSSNELNDESNLEVLSGLKLDVLDLSSNKISDVSKISNINTIPTLYLHDQKLSIVEIIEVDTTKESDQEDEMIFPLPQILEHAGYLKSEWIEDTVTGNGPRVNWSGFDHRNLKIKVAEKTETTYIPYKGLLTVTIEITDTTNKLYNSEIKLYFAVVTSDERGIHIKDENMYKAIKAQLLNGQSVNSDLISYYGTESNARRQLYERYYDEPQILVISIDDLINNITSLKLSKKQIRDISGIEYFVGLTSELDLSNNYIKDIEPLLKLQENKEKEEALLRDRLSEKMALASETISKLNPIYDDIEKTIEEIEKVKKERDELLEKVEKLTLELQQLQAEKEDLEGKLEGLDQDKVNLDEELKILQDELLELQNTKVTLEEELKALQDELAKLKEEHADLKVQMEQAGEANKDLEQQIANLEANIEKMKSDIETKTAEIDRINESIIVKNDEANQKQQAIYQAQEAIATYEVRISELNIQIQDKTKELGITLDEISNYVSMKISQEEIAKIIKSYNNELKELIINSGITDETTINDKLYEHNEFIYAMLEQPMQMLQDELTILKDLIVNKGQDGQTIEEQFNQIQQRLTDYIVETNEKIIPDIIVDLQGRKDNSEDVYDKAIVDVEIKIVKEIQQKIFANLNAEKIVETAKKLNKAYSSADAALDLNKLEAEVQTLVEEKLRLENIIADITNELKNGESGLLSQKNKIEAEIKELEEQKTALEAEIKKLEEQIATAEEELVKLKEELATSDATLEIEKLNQQIIEKEAEIDAKQKEIDTKQAEVDANNKAILDKEAEIKAKEAEIKAKEEEINKTKQEIEEKNNAITSKIEEINNILKDINSKNETIAGLELKLEQLQENRDLLEEILLQRMADIYETFRRVDKLASFAVPQLKTITDEAYDELKYDEAKSLYDSQIARIKTIEENLNTFEYKYLIKTYDIPTVEIKEIEKVVLQPDGTLKTETVTEEKEIENPISKFFDEQAQTTSDWNLSDYKNALYQFKTDDLYMNIYNYCVLYRYFNETTNCQKDNFVNNLIKELNIEGQSTALIKRVSNNYNSKLSELDMNDFCEGNESLFGEVVEITKRIISASGEDIDTYVVLPELKSLILTENLIENIDDITQLTGLRKLFVGDNELVDISNVNWSALKELRELDLSLNSISDIEALEVLEKLTYLDLSSNLISGKFTFDLSKLPNLKELNLSNNQISDIEGLVNYVIYEARNKGVTTVSYLKNYLGLDITGQVLTMKVEDNFDLNERRKEKLPKIFAQIEELDSSNTDFGIDSLGGNVTSDGKEVLLATNKYGEFNTVVTISSKYSSTYSIGEGTICTITYKVGEDDVDVEDKNIKLSITPTTATVEQGKTAQFTATVTGNGSIDKTVRWKISGNTSLETKISGNGLLTVASDEEAKTIRVEATSNEDPTISVGATVTIKESSTDVDPEEPDVPSTITVTVTPSENVNIKTGETQQFTVDIQGENIKERKIEWNLAGRTSQNTTITKEGLLTIGEDETAEELTLTVKVTVNGEIEDTKVIKIKVVKSEEPVDPDKPGENLNTEDLGYKVDNEYLTEVKAKTPINEFERILLNELDFNVEVTKNGSAVTTGFMGTDMQVKITDAEGKVVLDENGNEVNYKVVVKGDINGDGYANSLDTVLIKAHRNEVKVLEGSELSAGDINNDGYVNIADAKLLLYHRAEVTGFDLNFHK